MSNKLTLLTDFVFNAGIFSFSVFTNQDSVDIVIGSFEALDGDTWTDVGEKIKSATQGQVEGNVAFAN